MSCTTSVLDSVRAKYVYCGAAERLDEIDPFDRQITKLLGRWAFFFLLAGDAKSDHVVYRSAASKDVILGPEMVKAMGNCGM